MIFIVFREFCEPKDYPSSSFGASPKPARVRTKVRKEVLSKARRRRDRAFVLIPEDGGVESATVHRFTPIGLHYFIMHTVFSNPDMWKSPTQPMPPQVFFDAFVWFYLFMGVLLLAALVLNVLSGLFLWRRQHRVFSLVIGGLNCLQIPFGTALGVFTILVLSRDSVRELYNGQAAMPAALSGSS